MLKDLRKYDNLGTPQFFFELFNLLLNNGQASWTERDIRLLFDNRNINGQLFFDGCISLAIKIEMLVVAPNGIVKLNEVFDESLKDQKLMCDIFVERLLTCFKEDDDFQSIFSSKYVSYDIILHAILISNSAFGFKYSNLKQLLIDFDIIKIHPSDELNKFIINPFYKRLFDKCVLPDIKRKNIGIDELQMSLSQKMIFGEEAERFILEYEFNRLDGAKCIDWVAEYSVSEGYDIASFNSTESILNDRFIEVKSYVGKPNFYWSKNEINVARIKRDQYFLYLVNRAKILELGYEPLIIQDPYNHILKNSNHWDQSIENIKFTLK